MLQDIQEAAYETGLIPERGEWGQVLPCHILSLTTQWSGRATAYVFWQFVALFPVARR
jgi:hypothetical protein